MNIFPFRLAFIFLLYIHVTFISAESPLDAAPFILARGTVNGKKVLFDNAHANTAGQADWVIDGAFSDFANAIADAGYDVKELRKNSSITLEDLQPYHVFVTAEPNIPFKTTEQDAMLAYVNSGGAILFIADHYNADRNLNRWDGSEVINGYRRGAWADPANGMNSGEANSPAMFGVASSDWLSSNFGVRFRYNAIADNVATDIVPSSQALGVTAGVGSVALHAGSTLAITNPNLAKGVVYLPDNLAKWTYAVDQGVYSSPTNGRAEGPLIAIGKKGLGKTAFVGDSSAVEDATPKYVREATGASKTTHAGWQEQNDATMMMNLINWLATGESYTDLSQVPGLTLDTATALLAIETPVSSTEPVVEPFATPQAGYYWYNPATFYAGSYGYPCSALRCQNGGTCSPSQTALNYFVCTCASGFSGTYCEVGSGSTSLSETFNTGTKTAYASASVTLGSGSWVLSDALLATVSTTDKGNGAQTVRARGPSSSMIMSFDLTAGATAVRVRHARYSSDSSGTFALFSSTNGGSSWAQVGSSVTPGATLSTASFAVSISGNVRFKIVATTPSTIQRINLDDFQVDAATSCTPNPCANGGTCASTGTTTYTCNCATGWTGATCQTNIDDCSPNPCLNGGTCVDGIGSFTCNCASGWTGTLCDTSTLALARPVSENFDVGSKTSYGAANVLLSTGMWLLDNSLLGSLSTDRLEGVQSVRAQAPGFVTMNFNVASGVSSLSIKSANFGGDVGASWQLQKSTNNGATWGSAIIPDGGSTATITPSSTSSLLVTTSFTFSPIISSDVRFRFVIGGTSGKRINLDTLIIH